MNKERRQRVLEKIEKTKGEEYKNYMGIVFKMATHLFMDAKEQKAQIDNLKPGLPLNLASFMNPEKTTPHTQQIAAPNDPDPNVDGIDWVGWWEKLGSEPVSRRQEEETFHKDLQTNKQFPGQEQGGYSRRG